MKKGKQMKKTIGILVCCVVMLLGASFGFLGVNTFSRVSANQIENNDIAEFLEFEKAIIDLNTSDNNSNINYKLSASSESENEDVDNGCISDRKFALKRLIVKGEIEDTYGATNKISYKDLSILCYDTESETEYAFEKLSDLEKIGVFVDEIQQTQQYAEQEYNYDSYKNWGPKAMDIGGYRQMLVDNSVNKEVVVVVMDTGINTSHPMFSNRLLKNSNGKINGFSYHNSKYQYSYNNLAFDVDDPTTTDINEADTNKYSFEDDQSHGTHVAGIICDLTPSNVKILPIKVGDSGGFSSSSIFLSAYLRVINIYSKQYEVVCTNLSFSGAGKDSEDEKDAFNEYCYQPLLDIDIIPVTAAGNENYENNIEGLDAIVVSAVEKYNELYAFDKSYSNLGKIIDISAPGSLIYSAGISSTDSASSGYVYKSGTSMASPQVAGAVALLYLNPDLSTGFTAKNIEQILYDNAVDLGSPGKDKYYGHGMVNLKYFEVEKSTETILFYRDGNLVEEYIEYENFEDSFALQIECSDSSFDLIYTTDNTFPTINDCIDYTSAINVNDSIFLYVMGVKLENNEIIEKTSLYNISYFNTNTPVDDCFSVTARGYLDNYTGNFVDLTIPSTIDGRMVYGLEPSLFRYSNIESVTLPNTVSTVDTYAFQNCKNLKYIYAPQLTTINSYAFDACISLSSISDKTPTASEVVGAYFPNITSLGGYAFSSCTNLESVSLTKLSTLSKKGYDFADCINLKYVNLPAITSIPAGTFAFCSNLGGTFEISDKIVSIGVGAFVGCGLESFSVDSGNEYYSTDGFGLYSQDSFIAFASSNEDSNYTILDTVSIKNQEYEITNIMPYTMLGAKLNDLTIPHSITYLGLGSFFGSSINILYYNALNCTQVDINWGNSPLLRPFGYVDTIVVGANVEKVPQFLFEDAYFNNLIINSRHTIFSSFSLNSGSGTLQKLVFNFTEEIDVSYLTELANDAHLLIWNDIVKLYSKTEVPVEESTYFDHLIYSNYDGDYYVYSSVPLSAQYKITITSSDYGSVSPSGVNYVDEGESITVRFVPNEGCYVKRIVVDEVVLQGTEFTNAKLKGYTFTNITKNHSVSVTFAINTYTITVVQAQNGTISEAQNSYNYGTNATFTITPDAGYHIDHLIIDGVKYTDTLSNYTFENITANHTISASFAPNTNTRYFVRHWQESLTSSGAVYIENKYYTLVSTDIYDDGTTGSKTNVSAKSFDGFSARPFEQAIVLGDGSAVVEILYDRNIYKLELVKGENVQSTTGAGDYYFGENVSIAAVIEEGYEWVAWVSSDSSLILDGMTMDYSFEMPPGDIQFTATTTIKKFDVTIESTSGGKVLPSGDQRIGYGGSLLLSFDADEGFELKQLIIDGNDVFNKIVDNCYIISNIKEKHTVKAVFDLKKIDVIVYASSNGNISTESVESALYGKDLVCTFTPDEGYKVKDVKIDGVSVGAVYSYKLPSVTTEHSIVVEYEIKKFNIVLSVEGNGSIDTTEQLQGVEYGSTRTFTITPDEGWNLQKVHVNGNMIGVVDNKVTIEKISEDLKIVAYFQEKKVVAINFVNILIYGGTGISGIVVIILVVKAYRRRSYLKGRSKLNATLSSGEKYKDLYAQNSTQKTTQSISQNPDKLLQDALEFVRYRNDHFVMFCTKFNIDYKNNYNQAAIRYYEAYMRSKKNNPNGF